MIAKSYLTGKACTQSEQHIAVLYEQVIGDRRAHALSVGSRPFCQNLGFDASLNSLLLTLLIMLNLRLISSQCLCSRRTIPEGECATRTALKSAHHLVRESQRITLSSTVAFSFCWLFLTRPLPHDVHHEFVFLACCVSLCS